MSLSSVTAADFQHLVDWVKQPGPPHGKIFGVWADLDRRPTTVAPKKGHGIPGPLYGSNAGVGGLFYQPSYSVGGTAFPAFFRGILYKDFVDLSDHVYVTLSSLGSAVSVELTFPGFAAEGKGLKKENNPGWDGLETHFHDSEGKYSDTLDFFMTVMPVPRSAEMAPIRHG
jgi:hypothetical protein